MTDIKGIKDIKETKVKPSGTTSASSSASSSVNSSINSSDNSSGNSSDNFSDNSSLQASRRRYFEELAESSRNHFFPFIAPHMPEAEPCGRAGKPHLPEVEPRDPAGKTSLPEAEPRDPAGKTSLQVMELGCGEGGILLPFAEAGMQVCGIDLSESKIAAAKEIFAEKGFPVANFIAGDIFRMDVQAEHYDLIICHDVIEHIGDKKGLLERIAELLRPGGVAFIAFPAWQMPFGGHQQVCRNRRLSRTPWLHLLPRRAYRRALERGGESPACIDELLEIKSTACSIETFQRLVRRSPLKVIRRRLWLINPHYQTKFHLKPRRLPGIFAALPYLRDFLSTSCFYVLTK